MFSINVTPHASLKYSPFEIIFGKRPTFPVARAVDIPEFRTRANDLDKYLGDLIERLDYIRSEVRENSDRAAEKMERAVNEKLNVLALSPGDYVYLDKEPRGQGRKLKPTFAGPYVVDQIHSEHLVTLRDPRGTTRFPRPIHVNRLKVAHIRAPNPQNYLGHVQDDNVLAANSTTDDASVPSDGQERHHVDDILLATSSATEPEIPFADPDSGRRKSTRLGQKPVRFRDDSFVSGSDICSDANAKVKRVLAVRNNGNQVEYLVHYRGEPAQHAKWVASSNLPEPVLKTVKRKPPPSI